jgi:hypothetical protein
MFLATSMVITDTPALAMEAEMTDAEWSLYFRSLINEPTAKFWTAEEEAVYKKVGITITFSRMWPLLAPTHKQRTAISVGAGDATVTIPPVGMFKPMKLEVAASGRKLRYINENQLHNYDNTVPGLPQAWLFYNGGIWLAPPPNFTSSTYYNLWYLPRPTTLASLPEELHPLVAVDAALFAKAKDEDAANDLLVMRERMDELARTALSAPQLQDPEMMGFESMEDGMGDYGD